MATVIGSDFNDFIHVAGDGNLVPDGYAENDDATDGDDDITPGDGSDIVYAGGGDDTIRFTDNLDGSDSIDGGSGDDTVVIGEQSAIVFGAGSLVSVEKILLPFVQLPADTFGFQSLWMNDGNVAAGRTMTIDASGVGPDIVFSFDGSAETDGDFNIIGGTGDDSIVAGQNGDFIILSNGGTDWVTGGAGFDSILFGDTLTASDRIVVAGGDSVGLSGGSYAAGLTFSATTLVSDGATLLLSTVNDYKLIMNDANVVAGSRLFVQPNGFPSPHSLIFDGSAERDGAYSVTGMEGNDTITGGHRDDFILGKGGNDTLNIVRGGHDNANAGGGNDRIAAGHEFDALDTINGAEDTDTLTINGDYTAGVTFLSSTLTNVERIVLGESGAGYRLVTADATVAAGVTLNVEGGALGAGQKLVFNASAETDGKLVILGGAGDDVLTGGDVADRLAGGGGADTLNGRAGIDRYVYLAAGDFTSTGYDIIKKADFASDRWDVPVNVTAIDTTITNGKLGAANFDTQLANAVNSAHLGSHHAVLFKPAGGGLAGSTFLVVDLNGTAGYQAGADLVMQLDGVLNPGAIGVSDFV